MEGQHQNEYQGPFWRGNNAIFIVIKSISDVNRLLGKLLHEERRVAPLLDAHYLKYPEASSSEQALDEFSDIMERSWILESLVGCAASTAILMSAIDLESTINRFCFFELGETTADAIERLSMTAKLEVAHRALGLSEFKGSKPYQHVRELTTWRDKFAHGKTTDMPVRSLRENHLANPESLPDV